MLNVFRKELFLPHGNKYTAHTNEEPPTKITQFSTKFQSSNMNIF